MRWRKKADPFEERPVGKDVLKREVFVQRLDIDTHRHIRMTENRFDLRPEEQRRAADAIVQRLDAVPVARDEKSVGAIVPDGEREHAVEAVNAFCSPRVICGEHDFGISSRTEGVAGSFELHAQILEIVDLAVVSDDERAVVGLHRLMAERRQIDDRESAMTEADKRVAPESFAVRAAVTDYIRHPAKSGHRNRPPVDIENSGNAAHQALSPAGTRLFNVTRAA